MSDQKNLNSQDIQSSPRPVDAIEAQRLMQENLQQTREILKAVKDIQNNIKLQQLWGLLRFLVIIVPIILGFIYLPPLIKEIISSYRSFFR